MIGVMSRPVPHPVGTNSGQHWHSVRGEPSCDACRKAHADYERERRRAVEAGRPVRHRELVPDHGTLSGYSRHFREGEKACAACARAARVYHQRWRASRA